MSREESAHEREILFDDFSFRILPAAIANWLPSFDRVLAEGVGLFLGHWYLKCFGHRPIMTPPPLRSSKLRTICRVLAGGVGLFFQGGGVVNGQSAFARKGVQPSKQKTNMYQHTSIKASVRL